MSKTHKTKQKRDILPTEKESKHEWKKRKIESEQKRYKEIEDFGLDEIYKKDKR